MSPDPLPAETTTSMDRFSFAAREAARALDGFTLKAEQMKVVTSVLQGKRCLRCAAHWLRKDPVLRRPYPARSIIYNPEAHLYLVVVVSPLTAIMKDQVSKAVIV